MPWKECNVIDERLQFIARLRDGDKMSELCREFAGGNLRQAFQKLLAVSSCQKPKVTPAITLWLHIQSASKSDSPELKSVCSKSGPSMPRSR